MLIAQITDMHIVAPGQLTLGSIDTAAMLGRTVARLNALSPQPDVILITGDLTDTGEAAAYEHLRTLLAPLAVPFFVMPGNHDQRAALRTSFADHAYLPRTGPSLDYVVDDYPIRLVALDTLVHGQTAGALTPEQIRWLDDRLSAQPDTPTIVALHHPPFTVGIGFLDRMGLAGAPALAGVICRHGQVQRVVCGHIHRNVTARFAGTVASIAPSTAHAVPLALGPTPEPGGITYEPPGFHLHYWQDGIGLTTHTAHTAFPDPVHQATDDPRPAAKPGR